MLGGRHAVLGQQRQCIEIGLLQAAALVEVGQQPLADCRQVGARLLQVGDALRAGEQTNKGILAQVRRVAAIAHASFQPSLEPAPVIAVQVVEGLLRRQRCITHLKKPCAKKYYKCDSF
ncbi:hypothetical protein D3C80_1893910 [compost metagenome]